MQRMRFSSSRYFWGSSYNFSHGFDFIDKLITGNTMRKRPYVFIVLFMALFAGAQVSGSVLFSDDSISVELKKQDFDYSFKAADTYIQQKKYDVALYIYINLFPVDSARVVEKVMELDSLFDLPKEILKAFATNVIQDTEMFQMSNGVMSGSLDVMNKKAKWGDALIKAIKAKKIKN
jgi:hypothetical protein